MILELIAVATMALADRACGDGDDGIPKAVAAPVAGLALAYIMGHIIIDWIAYLYALGYWAARAQGLGNAIGPALTGSSPDISAPEWWQTKPLLESTYKSLLALGTLWGFLILIFTAWADTHAWKLLPVCIVSIPMAVFCARHSWGRQEYYRGGLIGLGAWLL